MTAEGYKSAPLSDSMELRIKERLKFERNEVWKSTKLGHPHTAAFGECRIAALEWVLNEAEALKLEFSPIQEAARGQGQQLGQAASRYAASNADFCPTCGHVHADDSECGFPLGGGRICRCERQVPA